MPDVCEKKSTEIMTLMRQTSDAPKHKLVASILVDAKVFRVGLLNAKRFFHRVCAAACLLGRGPHTNRARKSRKSK
jgi:hypothetical protein